MDVYGSEKYIGESDEALTLLAKQGDDDATAALLTRYRLLLRHGVSHYQIPGVDADDLLQEAMIGLLKGIRTYDVEQGVPFRPYALLCIRRTVASAVRSSLRLKHRPLGDYVSLEDESFTDTMPVGQEEIESPEQLHIWKEERRVLLEQIKFLLTDLEKDVLHLYLACVSYEEMARRLHTSVKSIDNALQRIRRKLRSENNRSQR